MNRRSIPWFVVLVATVGVGGCDLNVQNPNAPDTHRVLETPTDAENLMSGYYKRWHDGVFRGLGNLEGMSSVMSYMNYSSLANNCMNTSAPSSLGVLNNNTPGNVCLNEQLRLYQVEEEVVHVESSFLGTLGTTSLQSLGSPKRDLRGQAFAEFVRGLALGYLALFYDSAAVITPAQAVASPPDPGKLVSYKDVRDSALAAFDRAITNATNSTTANGPASDGFPLPATWIPSPTQFTVAEFVKLARSYKARFRAQTARDTVERAAVDWTQVIADAQNGITADFQNVTNTTTGPFSTWRSQYDPGSTWHQMPPFIIGMADTSGSYAAWIAQSLGARGSGNVSFFLATPDLRFPQGANRAAQQADFAIAQCEVATGTNASPDGSRQCKRYFVNRPSGNDLFSGLGWGWSNYDMVRWHWWNTKGDGGSPNNGTVPFFTLAELNMLQAEGLMRTGNYVGAMNLINITRVRNGLFPLVAPDNVTPVPGGNACVPKVPVGPTYTTVACGNMWEAMKYEKRIEDAFTTLGAWFLDNRGWGDLAYGTPTFWATPYQDLLARTKPVYSSGLGAGAAPNSSAGHGTYGW